MGFFEVGKEKLNYPILGACCIAIFWPGTLVFGFPGVMSQYWQNAYRVGYAQVGQILFFADRKPRRRSEI
jgi:hypothetical protein